MKARDVMTAPVLTVKSDSSVRDVAQLFVKHRISGAPVVDDQGHLVGMISEGDLMRRTELKSERQRSWWLGLLVDESAVANEYVKANSQKTSDVMAHPVMTVTPETPVADIAALFEKHGIKRVPVIENGALVGLVSRANLVQAIASQSPTFQIQQSDVDIRERLLKKLRAESWAPMAYLNVIVNDGCVELWGIVETDMQRQAIQVAAETADGVRAVNNHLQLPLERKT